MRSTRRSKYNREQLQLPFGDGGLKIYLPDGHLRDGGVEALWKHTGLPYPTEPYYMILNGRELPKGYPKGSVERVGITLRRPQRIPSSIENEGIGISGLDLCYEGFGIPLASNNGNFTKELDRRGIRYLLDLGCPVSHIVMAFLDYYGIDSLDDLRLKKWRKNTGGNTEENPRIASELPSITQDFMGTHGFREKEYEIMESEKPEIYPLSGDSHGVLTVAETGNTIRNYYLKGIEPIVLQRSTAQLLANHETYSRFKDFIDELVRLLKSGKEKEKGSEFFRNRFDSTILASR